MPGREARVRKQRAVYWARSGVDNVGEITLATYSEIFVQWLEKQSEMIDPQGNVVTVDVQVVLGQTITVGSVMAKGTYSNYATTDTKYKVVAYDEQRDLQNRFIRRMAGLMRYGVELPVLA